MEPTPDRGLRAACLLLFAVLCSAAPRSAAGQADELEWPFYGGDPGGQRYSPAAQIDRTTVRNLRLAWAYRTGDLNPIGGRFQATPLYVDGALYVSTPLGRVLALDPRTGAERWAFDPVLDVSARYGDLANRGLATWVDPGAALGAPCRRRIFVAPADARLVALDAPTGRPCSDFGTGGQVSLLDGLVNAPAYPGEYGVTSPPVVAGGLVIAGSAIADNQRADAPSGVVRAFDARTGALRWRWDPVPRDSGAPGYDTWRGPAAHRTGAANVWSVMSVDTTRGLVFLPVGAASPDFYGGERLGRNAHANSVVALHVADGSLAWSFQVVHHDLWDYDVPAQPVLFTWRGDGREIPAVAVATKMGHLFVLDRETGRPLLPVTERPVPPSTVPGEEAWPTQPFPERPAPLAPQRLAPEDAFGVTAEERAWCRARLAALRSDGIFTPPSLEGTVIFPGNVGGSHWGGVSIDPGRGVIVGPTNRIAFVVTLVPRDSVAARRRPGLELGPQRGTPYAMLREVLLAPSGTPCNPPPWGTLVALDAGTGERRWEVPFGNPPGQPDSARFGSVNLGGVLVTGGGLVFGAGTQDRRLRAFDVETGGEVWRAELPTGGMALPMSYVSGGRQYVVIVAGGHERMGVAQGDWVLAFALPDGAAPLRDSAPPLAGTYRGRLFVERQRSPVTLELRVTGGDSVSADLTVAEPRITGAARGRLTGGSLQLTVDFEYPAQRCTGTIHAGLERANGGGLLVGRVRVTGPCTGDAPDDGTLALWRD